MSFDEFVKRYQQHIQSEERRSLNLAQLLGEIEPSELADTVHLLQGRFDAGYRRPSPTPTAMRARALRQLRVFGSSSQHRVRGQSLHLTPSQVYQQIHLAWTQVDNWLSLPQAPIPTPLIGIIEQVAPDSCDFLAQSLTGPWPADGVLLAAVAELNRLRFSRLGSLSSREIENLNTVYSRTLPDLGVLAVELITKDLHEVLLAASPRVGTPVPSERLRVLSSVEEAWRLFGRVTVEFKYDGYHIQLHKHGDRVHLFSRGRYNREWEDIADKVKAVTTSCVGQIMVDEAIIEAELVGLDADSDRVVPFQDTLRAARHRLYAYDLLHLNGKDLRQQSLIQRTQHLRSAIKHSENGCVYVMPEWPANSVAELQALYEKSIAGEKHEGIIVKNQLSRYNSGGLSEGQGKLKPYVSFDVVILGYWGDKSRPSAYLAGLWSSAPNDPKATLVPVAIIDGAKIKGSERHELLLSLKPVTSRPLLVKDDLIPQQWVEPEMVLEVGCDGHLVQDGRYRTTQYTFRDITFLRLRSSDKTVWNANDVNSLLSLRLAPGEH